MEAKGERHRYWQGLLVFSFLWCVFLAFGLYLRTLMPWDAEAQLHGLDYGFYGDGLSRYKWIFGANFRHPLLGVLTAPLPLLGQRMLMLGPWPYWGFVLSVFSAVMAGCTLLVYAVLNTAEGTGRMCATAGAALFASFSYTWFLAACPESFSFACLAGLLVLLWGVLPCSRRDGRAIRAGWIAMAVLNGGITVTNGIKVVLAYLVVRGFSWRRVARLATILATIVLLASVIILARYAMFRISTGGAKANLSDGLVQSFQFIERGIGIQERLSKIASCFSEPIVTHGDPLEENIISRPYGTVVVPWAIVALYVSAAIGACRLWRHVLVRLVLAMFSVDLMLHVVVSWGLAEGHIYCGHWLYVPAILSALLPTSFKGRWRSMATAGVFVLALVLFVGGVVSFVAGVRSQFPACGENLEYDMITPSEIAIT